MAKQNCGTCNRGGMAIQSGMPNYPSNQTPKLCNRGCFCKTGLNPGVGLTYTCHPKRAQQNRDRHLNASGFLGTGVSGFKVIWWSLGALLLLGVVGKGIKVYKQAKS